MVVMVLLQGCSMLTYRNTALINLYDDIQSSWTIVFIGIWK